MLGVGLDFSELMLDAAGKRFGDDERIELVQHDFAQPLGYASAASTTSTATGSGSRWPFSWASSSLVV